MKKNLILVAALCAVANVGAQERITYKLEMVQPGAQYRQVQMNATLGQPSLYNETTRATGNAGSPLSGVWIRLLPQSIEPDGAIVTEVYYGLREHDSAKERFQLVTIKRGETLPLAASSPGGGIVRLSLAN